jgi:hypothetical protein
MRVMVIVKASKASEAGQFPSTQLLSDMGKFNEELIRAGVLLAADGLQPSSKGKRIRYTGTRRTVVDGPFSEAKELVGGFWLWQVRSMEEAMEWAKRCPRPHEGDDCEIEIRPVFEMEDFAKMLPPELKEQHENIKALRSKGADKKS